MSKKRSHKIRKKGLPPGTLIYTGNRDEHPSEVLSIWYNETHYTERESYVPECRELSNNAVWVDVRNLSDTATVERIGNDFHLHPLALEDVLDTSQRAKMEEYDNCLFIIVHNLHLAADRLELVSEQIAVFLGPNFVISFQEDPDDTFQGLRTRAHQNIGRLRKKGSDYLTYTILDTIVDNYYTVLDEIESILQELEASMHHNGAESETKARIFKLKQTINQFRHRVMPLRDSVARLYRTECAFIEETNRPYLRDLMDHVAQIIDSLDNYREILSGIESLYQAEVSNRLNNVMRLLTIISTIFIPLSFIAGVYGMNFDNMPELHWRFGYFIVLGAMFLAIVGMLIYFRRNRWI